MSAQASEWKTAEELAAEKAERKREPLREVVAEPVEGDVPRCFVCSSPASNRDSWIYFLGQPRVPLCSSCLDHGKNVATALPYFAKMLQGLKKK